VTHTQHEDMPWTTNVGDHPARADSPEYGRSRKLMIKLVQLCQPWGFGPPPYQDHHGGGVWLKDASGWFLTLGLLGGEWSSQFCADPVKVDRWRAATKRLVDAFPETIPGYVALGYPDGGRLLATPINGPSGIAAWFDGIFNASVPLPALDHTGVLPKGAGYHHYPKSIKDIDFFKRDDFTLWVVDPASGVHVAVAPVAPRGSGDGRVAVIYAPPGHPLAPVDAHVVLEADHPIAQQAFAAQGK
jgi:Family of unknown function (DUF6424)